jgi:hypothetical protein
MNALYQHASLAIDRIVGCLARAHDFVLVTKPSVVSQAREVYHLRCQSAHSAVAAQNAVVEACSVNSTPLVAQVEPSQLPRFTTFYHGARQAESKNTSCMLIRIDLPDCYCIDVADQADLHKGHASRTVDTLAGLDSRLEPSYLSVSDEAIIVTETSDDERIVRLTTHLLGC